MLMSSTIPFDLFWNNYGNFQLTDQQGSSSSKTPNCSFENLSAMQESTRPSTDVKTIIDEKNIPQVCQCPHPNVKIKTELYEPKRLPQNIYTERSILSPSVELTDSLPKIFFTPTIALKPDDVPHLPPLQKSSTISMQPPEQRQNTFAKPHPPVINLIEPKQEDTVMSERNDERSLVLYGKSDKGKPTDSRFCPYKVQRKNFKQSKPLLLEAPNPGINNIVICNGEESKEKEKGKEKAKAKRFEWSALLHEEFIKAYEYLAQSSGYPTPKAIMNQMEKNGAGPLMEHLTRIHVNTHLQKYELSMVQAPKRQSKFFAFRARNLENVRNDFSNIQNPLPSMSESK